MTVSCSAAPPLLTAPIDGQVLDFDSRNPIAGAIVVARWEGAVGMWEASQACVHVETTVSDSKGRFHFDIWAAPTLALFVRVNLSAYRKDYEGANHALHYTGYGDGKGGATTWNVYDVGRPYEVLQSFADEASAFRATLPMNVYMNAFSGTDDARFEHLNRDVYSGMACMGRGAGADAGTSKRNLYPLYKAALQEAQPLARNAEQKRRLQIMQDIAAEAWLAGSGDPHASGSPLFRVPKEVCLELGGHERLGMKIRTIVQFRDGRPDQVTERYEGDPPC